jgi:hypothetical protein
MIGSQDRHGSCPRVSSVSTNAVRVFPEIGFSGTLPVLPISSKSDRQSEELPDDFFLRSIGQSDESLSNSGNLLAVYPSKQVEIDLSRANQRQQGSEPLDPIRPTVIIIADKTSRGKELFYTSDGIGIFRQRCENDVP